MPTPVSAKLAHRAWVPDAAETFVQNIAASLGDTAATDAEVERLIGWNREIHEHQCVNLNPATNAMNPRAEAAMARGLGSRPSLGYPGDKYEMGLEAIERIEVIAAELAARVFDAKYVEVRLASGAMANLAAFMATCKPGDAIIAQSADIGGHVTHHNAGEAGLYGLDIHASPVNAEGYTVDLAALRQMALTVRPKLITIGGSMNLFPHPIADVRAIADEVGAKVLFDAAHMSGMIAGKAWQQPLAEGAHLMTMSTYKSLGGPPAGLLLTNEADLAKKVDAIVFPGLTANFDAAKTAALAITLLDWVEYGEAYAAAMHGTAVALATALASHQLPIHAADRGFTTSHQFALEAAQWGGGQAAARNLRNANILTCGIGLPIAPVEGDMNGLRFGTPEIVRWGMTVADMPKLAELIARALTAEDNAIAGVAADVTTFRQRFKNLSYIRQP